MRRGEPERARTGVAQGPDERGPVGCGRRASSLVARSVRIIWQARGMVEEVGQGDVALSLSGAAVAERQQPRQPAIGGAIHRIGQDVGRAVREDEAGPDGEAEAVLGGNALLDETIGPHDAGQRVAVGDADAGMADRMGLGHQFLGMRGAAQEREIGDDGEVGEAGHGA